VIDDPSVVDFILRRARDIELVNVYPAGAATKGLRGRADGRDRPDGEAGCVYVTDADRPIVDSKVLQRVLAYAKAFDVPGGPPPADPWLSAGRRGDGGEFASRMGLPSVPAVAERIMLERDLALVELTGARLLVDQITTAGALETLARAATRAAGPPPPRSTTCRSTRSTSATTAPSAGSTRRCAARTTARR
jgi:dihydroorotase